MTKFKTIEEEINYIKKQMNIMTEQHKHEYGCAMLFFDFPDMVDIHDIIDSNDVYEEDGEDYGLETEPHTTLLFGLHEGIPTSDIESVLKDFTFEDCIAHNASIFENEKYDVLKFDVKGKNLKEANDKLKEFPYTSDYPEYHPHMTIAYITPGNGEKYCKILKDRKYSLSPKYAVYSKTDGTKDKITVKIK